MKLNYQLNFFIGTKLFIESAIRYLLLKKDTRTIYIIEIDF